MLKLSVLVPDATINYVKNPALRYATTDWNAQGSTISRVLTYARFGIASLKVVTNGAALNEGAYYRVSSLVGISEPITVSAYVRGTGTIRIRLDNNVVGGTEYSSAAMDLLENTWQRISVSGYSTGGNDMRLFVETAEGSAKVRTFYVDGAQMERKAYPTTYCDGDQEGCRWLSVYHNSTSSRDAYTRAGGRWVQLAGDERVEEDLYMTVVGGLGVAPISNNTQDFALSPGGFYQSTKVNTRTITLTFFAKHLVEDQSEPVSLAALHQLRQLLIDVMKPDKTISGEAIWFEYDDGNTPLYFQARYDGGLEGEWDIRNQFVNSFPLRLLGVNPLIYEDSQEAAVLDFQDSIQGNRALGYINEQWSNLNYGFSDVVFKMAYGPTGIVYAIGTFVTVNNNAAAVDPLRTANGVAYWDGEKWNAMGSGMNVLGLGCDIAVGANGYVYVSGFFTSINGVAANRIAYWNGTTWNAMGTGLNGNGYCLAVAPNGDVYVGGTFTTAGGISCARIARWDGSQWNRVGQYGGLNDIVDDIAVTVDGLYLYVAGIFTDQNGLAANGLLRAAKYTVSTGLFSAMGSGFNGQVRVMKVAPSGIVYAGGAFTASGSNTINYFAQWNGAAWLPQGGGVNGDVYDLDFMDDGSMVLVGAFTVAGTLDSLSFAFWNGSTFANFGFRFSTTFAPFYCVLVMPKTNDIFFGGQTFSTASNTELISGITYVTNPGTIETRPIVYLLGPGTLRWMENLTTGKRLYFNLMLFAAEEVFVDFGQGTIGSIIRPNLLSSLLPGSDFRGFTLLPGENKIACLMTNDVNATAQMTFQPAHWSADATQHGEAL